MEIAGLSQELAASFGIWKTGEVKSDNIARLNEAISFAHNNGIDLILKVPKAVLNKTATTKPITRQDAIEYSSRTDNHSLFFEILSKLNSNKVGYSKRLELHAVDNYREIGAVICIKNQITGTFGVFLPDEVESLDLK